MNALEVTIATPMLTASMRTDRTVALVVMGSLVVGSNVVMLMNALQTQTLATVPSLGVVKIQSDRSPVPVMTGTLVMELNVKVIYYSMIGSLLLIKCLLVLLT